MFCFVLFFCMCVSWIVVVVCYIVSPYSSNIKIYKNEIRKKKLYTDQGSYVSVFLPLFLFFTGIRNSHVTPEKKKKKKKAIKRLIFESLF